VVRIDSPGGDGSASDLIWRELVRARKEKHKPVVASMGDVAASGGYYVAAGADEIVAEPSTITGSIGVFIGHFDAGELYGKLGLAFETTKRGQSADLFSTTRGLTGRERNMMQSWVDSFYDEFIGRVAEGRGLSKAEVDAVGRGRIWSGAQALQRGLVDRLGGLEEAIRAAKARAGVGEDAIVEDAIPVEVGLPELALQGAIGAAPLGPASLGLAKKALRAVQLVGAPGTIRAVMPAEIEVR
jgi:protease-4